ncbi:MAG: single-stranded-DNA-specific exonuclease RecJ [Opitutales bacterium]
MKWNFIDYDQKLASDLGAYLGVSHILAGLLIQRGFSDPIKAKMFLKPKLADLDDPFRLTNLRKAVTRIIEAIDKKQKVLVFGDYDVDGITSAVLLVSILKYFKVDVSYFVPRRMDEGYGLSIAALERALSGSKPDLFIALDCGTNAYESIDYIRQKDIDLIIVDHHQAKEFKASDCIFINPHVLDISNAPWRNLCTVGLVFKLAHGLIKALRELSNEASWALILKDYMDLVVLGTVADLVPLLDENRIMAKYGLKKLKSTKRTGIKALIQVSGMELGEDITPIDISFKLGPRINASGRLADANLPLEMLLGDDFTTCYRAACELNDINKERQDIERGVFEEAMKQIDDKDISKNACIVVSDKNWHPGVVGIIAGKLSREYNRPVIVFGEISEDGYAKGSGRSIAGINFVECMDSCKEYLGNWGGHPMAVGLSVKTDMLDDFTNTLNATIVKKYKKDKSLFDSHITISMELSKNNVGIELLDELELLYPYGEGNKEPIFMLKNVVLSKEAEVFGNNANYKLQIPLANGAWISAVAWRLADDIPPTGKPLDFAVKLAWNRWKRQKMPQATIIDYRLSK